MSASCPPSDASPRQARGFTLLELLVVLALVGMMAAMVAPRLQGTYEAIASSGERAEVARQLERLPLVARDRGRSITLAPGGATPLQMPAGWTVTALDAVLVDASGICHGGRVVVRGRGSVETWTLSPPDCGVADGP